MSDYLLGSLVKGSETTERRHGTNRGEATKPSGNLHGSSFFVCFLFESPQICGDKRRLPGQNKTRMTSVTDKQPGVREGCPPWRRKPESGAEVASPTLGLLPLPLSCNFYGYVTCWPL